MREELSPEDPADDNMDRFVGVALEMARGGQVLKAAATYNRWAAISRRPSIEAVQANPPGADVAAAPVEPSQPRWNVPVLSPAVKAVR